MHGCMFSLWLLHQLNASSGPVYDHITMHTTMKADPHRSVNNYILLLNKSLTAIAFLLLTTNHLM